MEEDNQCAAGFHRKEMQNEEKRKTRSFCDNEINQLNDGIKLSCCLLGADEGLSLKEFLTESQQLTREDSDEHWIEIGRDTPDTGYGTPFGRLTPTSDPVRLDSVTTRGFAISFGHITPLEFFPCNGRITPSGYLTPLFATPLASGRTTPYVDCASPLNGRVTPVCPVSPLSLRKQIIKNDFQLGLTSNERKLMDDRGEEYCNRDTSEEFLLDREISMPEMDTGQDLYPNCDVTIWLRSCKKEVVQPIQGDVTGTVPMWLNGTLIRNGPGSLEVGDMTFDHLFDSSALLHRFAISGGKVTYQNRFLQSQTYKRNQAAQRIVVTEFGTKSVPDPCQSIFRRVAAMFRPGESMSDNAMISVYPFGDELYAFTESPVIHRIDPRTLDTMERVNVSDYVGIVNHTSHPHVLPDATVYNMGMTVSTTGPSYTIIKFPPSIKAESATNTKRLSTFDQASILCAVRARWPLHPAYMHTFGITDNYFIIVEQPLSVSVGRMVKNQWKNEPMATCLKWYNDKETLIHLISRQSCKLYKTFYAKAFFYLHIINQYEDRDHMVLDICCYKDAAMLDCMYIDSLKGAQHNPDYASMFRGRPMRFVLPLDHTTRQQVNLVTLPGTRATASKSRSGHISITPEVLCDLGCETPRINYDTYLGKHYRYFYAISSDVDLDNPGTLIKVDIESKSRKTWCEENVFPSEPIFVARPDPKSEDDGVVLAALVWGQGLENKAGLLVLDAVTWTEVARATFATPSAVPKCLHGWFTNTVN